MFNFICLNCRNIINYVECGVGQYHCQCDRCNKQIVFNSTIVGIAENY